MKKSSNKGFTLVELIIVIAILAIIMLIAIPNFSGIQQRMQVRADKATAAQIGKAVRVWFTDCTTDENLIAGDTTATIIPSELGTPSEKGKVSAMCEYSTLKGIDSYVTTNYRATSLKKADGTAFSDNGKSGGYYAVFLTSNSTDASAKIAIAIVSGASAVVKSEGISGIASDKTVTVNYDGKLNETAGSIVNGGVAYVEP